MKEECSNAERRELGARMQQLEVDNKKQEIRIKMLEAENKAKREAVAELEALKRVKKRVERWTEDDVEEVEEVTVEEVEMMMGVEGADKEDDEEEVTGEEEDMESILKKLKGRGFEVRLMGEEMVGQAVEMDEAAELEGNLEGQVDAGFLERLCLST